MKNQQQDDSTPATIQEKIRHARSLHATWRSCLEQDPGIQRLLARLQRHAEGSMKTMIEVGLVAECKHCEEEQGGSCCGSGIENRYDPVLLLINMLLGVSLPNKREQENSCYFLGGDGCKLLARHVLCVNYLCAKLQQALTRDRLVRLQDCAGEELQTEFILHEAIKKHIRL